MKIKIFVAVATIILSTAVMASGQNNYLPADSVDFFDENVVLPELKVAGIGSGRSNSQSLDAGVVMLDKEHLLNMPTMTGEPDIIKAFTMQPGVSEGVEGFSGLFVRGGTNDQNLILLDGVPLYQISHLGGLFSSFNVEIVDNATFYKAAFPAMYGGRLSSVVDITTRKPDFKEYHGALSLGLTSGMAHVTGPIFKDKTAFDVSVRRSWFDVLTAPALAILNKINEDDGKKTIARYAFTDINARIDHRFGEGNVLRANFYWGNDLFKFGNEEFSASEEESDYLERHEDKLRWGNTMLSVSWDYRYNDYLKSSITASYTRYKSRYHRESLEKDEEGEEQPDRTDINSVDDISLHARWKYSRRDYDLHFGAFYVNHNFLPSSVEFNSSQIHKAFRGYRIHANETGAYADFKWEPVHWFGMDAGLRLSAIGIYDKWNVSLEPRFLARFTLLPRFSFKVNYARMRQFVQQVSDSYVNLPTDNWMPMGKDSGPLTSDQVGGGFYYDMPDMAWSFAIEGYYKWLDGVAEVNDDYTYGYDKMQNIEYGEGNAYGAELTVTRNSGRLTGSLSYGLMWANRRIPGINDGNWYPAKFDNRHKINLVLNYKLSERIELNASWVYATGNRMTVPIGMYQGFQDTYLPGNIAPQPGEDIYHGLGLKYYGERNNVRLPGYHRLDVSASFTRQLGNGRKGVWRVGLYNAYCRMNPIVVRRQEMTGFSDNKDRPWDVYYETFSIFPIIPNVSYTYYF